MRDEDRRFRFNNPRWWDPGWPEYFNWGGWDPEPYLPTLDGEWYRLQHPDAWLRDLPCSETVH